MEWVEQVWSKLYSKKFLEEFNIFYNDYPCHEDMEYSLKVRMNVPSIFYLNEILINYRVDRAGSLMDKHYKYTDCIVKSYLNAEKWCTKLDKKVCDALLKYEFYLFYHHLINSYNAGVITLNDLKDKCKQINFLLLEGNIRPAILLDCKEIMSLPQWLYKARKILKKFLKNYIPSLYYFIINLKKKS